MDIPYGSPPRTAFATNVGLVTSNGPHGYNIMAAEWTYQMSYSPGLLAVSFGKGKATPENIDATGYFGVSIAASDQNVLASLAGNSSGRDVEKIAFLREMGFVFTKAETIDVYMPDGAAMQAECTLVSKHVFGDHTLYIGEAQAVRASEPEKAPLLYWKRRYWSFGAEIEKPSDEERARMNEIREKYRKA